MLIFEQLFIGPFSRFWDILRVTINQKSLTERSVRDFCGEAETRTKQLCEEITVSKEIVATLLLAAGGKGGVSVGGGGGGSNNELTNWDGTKKER